MTDTHALSHHTIMPASASYTGTGIVTGENTEMQITPIPATAKTTAQTTASEPIVYLGTGGYSDEDLVGTLYPVGTKPTQYLAEYAKHYSVVEVNSSFYAPIGRKAFAGMVKRSGGRLRFSVKLHQDFSHARTGTPEHALAFIDAIAPLLEAEVLVGLLLQFPHGFERSIVHRRYLARLCEWFADYPLTIEFRHPSWHTPQVIDQFRAYGLMWCSVDYPKVAGLPPSRLLLTQSELTPSQLATGSRTGYLRLHGNNTSWWDAMSASERHDYRYTEAEMMAWAQTIANQRQHFDILYVLFQNTVKGHAVANIAMLRQALTVQGLTVF